MTTFLLGLLLGSLIGAFCMFAAIVLALSNMAVNKPIREYVGNWLLDVERDAIREYVAARKEKENQDNSKEEQLIS